MGWNPFALRFHGRDKSCQCHVKDMTPLKNVLWMWTLRFMRRTAAVALGIPIASKSPELSPYRFVVGLKLEK